MRLFETSRARKSRLEAISLGRMELVTVAEHVRISRIGRGDLMPSKKDHELLIACEAGIQIFNRTQETIASAMKALFRETPPPL